MSEGIGDVLAGRRAWHVEQGDALAVLRGMPDGCVQCCVTSPPYFALRDYNVAGQIGLEPTPTAFVARLVEVFGELRRVLRDDGTFWLNVGDSYATHPPGNRTPRDERPRSDRFNAMGAAACADRMARRADTSRAARPKELLGIPWTLAFALRESGWLLRSEIQWCKKSPMPESVRDRPTRAHEQIFLFVKRGSYFYDQEAEWVDSVRPGDVQTFGKRSVPASITPEDPRFRNGSEQVGRTIECAARRNLWSWWDDLAPTSFPGAHFATFPLSLPLRCLRLGTSAKGCCPHCGAPWARVVERKAMRIARSARGEAMGNRYVASGKMTAPAECRTTDWAASCDCPPADPVPCVALDCFTGSGTTGVAARSLGRQFVGIELNESYSSMARKRIADVAPLADAIDSAPRQPAPTLFDSLEGGVP